MIRNLIVFLVAVVVVLIVCYILVYFAQHAGPPLAGLSWIVWVIGFLVVLLVAMRIFGFLGRGDL
jgi:hypothetical protein